MKTNEVHKFIKCTLVNISTEKFKDTFSIPVEVERKEYSEVNISKCFLSLFYSSVCVKYNLSCYYCLLYKTSKGLAAVATLWYEFFHVLRREHNSFL